MLNENRSFLNSLFNRFGVLLIVLVAFLALAATATAHEADETPDKMDAPTVTPTNTNTELMVTGDKPHSHGHPIQGYEVHYRVKSSSIPAWKLHNVTDGDVSLSTTLTDLSTGVEYEVRVLAWNEWGKSSDLSDTATGTPGSPPVQAPEPPTGLELTASTATTLTLTWTASTTENVHHEIEEVPVHVNNPIFPNWRDTDSDTTHTITGLAVGQDYTVGVRAVSSTGLASDPITVFATTESLSAPTGLWVTPGDEQLAVGWTSVEGARQHQVRHSETQGEGEWETLENSQNPWDFLELTNGTLYYIQVRGITATITGPVAEITGTPNVPTEPPAPPTNVKAEPHLKGDQLRVTWTRSANATSHEVRYGTSSGTGTWVTATSPHVIEGLTAGTQYYVGVRAVNAEGNSTAVEDTGTPIGGVTNFNVAPGDMQLTVTWTDAPGATAHLCRYQLQGEDNGEWMDVDSPYVITGLTNGTAYHVQLRAKNDSGLSAHVHNAVATPMAPPTQVPGTPTNLISSYPASGEITLEWTSASGATSHEVNYYKSPDTNFDENEWVSAQSNTSHTFTGLTNKQEYTVGVRGVNDVGAGQPASKKATPWAPIPATPPNFMATPGDRQLMLTWTPVMYAEGYEIEYYIDSQWSDPEDSDTESSHTLTGLTNDREYVVIVRAWNTRTGNRLYSQAAQTRATPGTTPPQPPQPPQPPTPPTPQPGPAPSGLEVIAGDGMLRLSWNPVAGALIYEVAVVPGPWVGPLQNWRPVGTDTTSTVTGLTNTLMYVVGVRAVLGADSNGNRITSGVVTGSGVPRETPLGSDPEPKPREPEQELPIRIPIPEQPGIQPTPRPEPEPPWVQPTPRPEPELPGIPRMPKPDPEQPGTLPVPDPSTPAPAPKNPEPQPPEPPWVQPTPRPEPEPPGIQPEPDPSDGTPAPEPPVRTPRKPPEPEPAPKNPEPQPPEQPGIPRMPKQEPEKPGIPEFPEGPGRAANAPAKVVSSSSTGAVEIPQPVPVVHVADAALRTAINTALGKPASAVITPQEMQILMELNVTGIAKLTNLTGLETAINLRKLVSQTGISDIAAVASLTRLRTLTFNDTEVSDISALENLTALATLAFNNTEVSDISVLSGLTALEEVRMQRKTDGVQIPDISALLELTALKTVWMRGIVVEMETAADIATLKTRGVEVIYDIPVERTALTVLRGKTALLASYPNPFNPETWIPYQLKTATEVTIRIHSADGSLVRTLALGEKPAGLHASRSRAAYWDGRNAVGEPVASGIYFYTLTAGDFTATRKMLIRK